MIPNYHDVVTRFLDPKERGQITHEPSTPLVIEPRDNNSIEFLSNFLKENSTSLKNDLAEFGAILLRGFETRTDQDFELTLTSIEGFRPISEVLYKEAGRQIIENTNAVFPTNSIYKTGGTIDLPSFHNENYYSPDVPRHISFFCKQPSSLGGETGLVNMTKLYANLPEQLRSKLKSKSLLTLYVELESWANECNRSVSDLIGFCHDHQLPVIAAGGKHYFTLFKPSVITHPDSGDECLLLNFNHLNSQGLSDFILQEFKKDYRGKRWWFHQACWMIPDWLLSLKYFSWKETFELLKSRSKTTQLPYFGDDLNSIFSKQDFPLLAKLIRRHHTTFLWKKNDILIIDNLKMAHEGMPGAGERLLRVMMCNPMKIALNSKDQGFVHGENYHVDETLGALLKKIPITQNA
jgi:alpha-ketoglutarate-dependent taurine dioxygenase